MKWNGKNLAGFEVSNPPCIKNQEKYFLPWGCRGFKMFFVCLSMCLSPLQSELTFDPMVRSWTKFQGHPNSLQAIFGQPPSGSDPDHKRAFLSKSISSQRIGAGGLCHTILEMGGQGKKMLATAWENRFGRWGWPGTTKIWEFQFFS